MALLISMLKTTRSSDSAQRDNDNKVVGCSGDRNLSKSKKSNNIKSGIQTHIEAMGKPTFLTLGAREAFHQLKQTFTKALILRHFDLECHIRIETNASRYTIDGVPSQLTSDQITLNSKSILTKSDFGQWQPVAYFSRKMIFAKTY